MRELQYACLKSLQTIANDIAKDHPESDWGWRMTFAVGELCNDVDRGLMTDDSMMTIVGFVRQLQDATDPKRIAKQNGKSGAKKLHSKAGGTYDKQKSIVEAWQRGTYKSRDECAEQECAHIGMSFSAARKALRKVPKT